MDPFLGQVILFAGNFAPRGWAFCAGQLLEISQYMALFSILGTTYGGDGRTTFALPDLRGSVPIGEGRGPGLSDYMLGQRGGTETTTLTVPSTPSHNHSHSSATRQVVNQTATSQDPTGYPAAPTVAGRPVDGFIPGADVVEDGLEITNTTIGISDNGQIGNTGGSQSHDNRQPFLAMNYIIALEGVYPSRN
jgi:microcystin-dependent protein